jgi:hypothetical protein
MNYERIYNQLIEKRKSSNLDGYVEKHHILPRSLGGSDSEDNLVKLTAREHFIAHLLLAKFKPCKQTVYAVWMMQCKSDNQQRYDIKNSRMYAWARSEFKKYLNQNGKHNSQYGTIWICNIELKENKKISKDNDIPEGWIKGRNKWKPKRNSDIISKRSLREKENIKRAYLLFNQYVNSEYSSIRNFVKETEYPHSVVALTKLWKRYVKEYQTEWGKSFQCSVVDR